ncbi:MAG TPA: hypothetical protein VNJ70_13445 [Thermoanaerobaculia bacterium]|nr:hypothetical protein [Thermoanaerobaculia bacterium]
MSNRGKAPRSITWLICLLLYIVAILVHFGVLQLGNGLGDWAWIVGYALLLIAVQVRGL